MPIVRVQAIPTPTPVIPLPAGFRFAGPWAVVFQSPGQSSISEVYVATPVCKSGPCDTNVVVQDFDGNRIGAGVFRRGATAYTYASTVHTTADCAVTNGLSVTTTTSLAVNAVQPAGIAITTVEITGSRQVVETPRGASGCAGLELSYSALGQPTEFAYTPPNATPKPQTTPAPNAGGAPPGGGSSGNGYTYADYLVLKSDISSINETYTVLLPRDLTDLANTGGCESGMSPFECTNATAAGKAIEGQMYLDITGHLHFMNAHPPAHCFSDLYAADRTMAKSWLALLPNTPYGNGTPEGAQGIQLFNAVEAKLNTFLAHANAYVSDCR